MFTNNKLNKAVRLAMAFGAVSTLAFAGSVSAQDTTNDEEAKDKKAERIQVIGSRIRTDGFESSVPVEIISADIATTQGLSTLGDLLRTSTIASGSNQLTSALTVGYVTAGGSGTESISMRGLGANRTLILLNGRRAGPAGTRGQVNAFDLNSLPVSLIERVEILKDGASSLYGSDAVAGVINIITKKGDDSSFNVNLSQPFESGGESKRFDFTFGKTFDKGSIRFMADYKLQEELARGDRDYYSCKERVIFDQVTGERADPIDPRTGSYHCADTQSGIWVFEHNANTHPTGNFLTGMKGQYDYGGVLAGLGTRPMPAATGPNGITLPDGWFPVSYDRESDAIANTDHPFQDLQSFIPETEVKSVYFQADYNLSDNVRVFGDIMHSRRSTESNSYRQFWNGDRRILGTALVGENDYNRGWGGASSLQAVAMTDWTGGEVDVNYTRYVLGLDGSIGDWDWEVSYQNSYNKGTYKNKIIHKDSMDLAQSLLPTMANPDAQYCSGQVTPISGKTCVNLRWLDPEFNNGNLTPAERDFLFGWDVGTTIYRQSTLEASVSGDLFQLPAGSVGVAFGAQHQRDELNDTPGEQTLNGNVWGSSSSGITAGSQSTKAVFSELQIPLLADVFLVKQLDVVLSGRWTDVSTYGSDSTYKAGLNWEIAGGVRARASRGTSFRSPALFELYLGNQTGFLEQSTADPCLNWSGREIDGTIDERVLANCKAEGVVPASYTSAGSSALSVTGGGAGTLKAETSVAETVGLVWTSSDNEIAASIDWYQYQINGQISNVGGANITNNCYRSENFASEPLCNQFTRRDGTNGDYGIDTIFGGYLNVASQKMRGIDLSFSYNLDTDFGRLGFDYKHNIQIEQTYQLFESSTPSQYIGDVGSPKHSGSGRIVLNRDGWAYSWTTYITGKADDWKYFSSTTTAYRGERYNFIAHTPTYITHTASVRTSFKDLDVTFGIANVFGKEPPKVSAAGGFYQAGYSALYSQYDAVGRRAFANIAYNF